MGLAFEAPLALLPFIPAFLLDGELLLAQRTPRRWVVAESRSCSADAARGAGPRSCWVCRSCSRSTASRPCSSSTCPTRSGAPARGRASVFVRGALEEMPEGDVAGIVAFGKEGLVERLPSDLAYIDRIASAPVRSASDIGGALRLATALFPDDAQKRIVLLSDGNDTTGTGQAEAALSATRGVRIETRQIGLGASDEVLVERASSPSTTRLGEDIEIVVGDPLVGRAAGNDPPVRQRHRGRRGATRRPRGGGEHRPLHVHPDRGRLPSLPRRRRGRSRHLQPEQPRGFEHDRPGRAADAGAGR